MTCLGLTLQMSALGKYLLFFNTYYVDKGGAKWWSQSGGRAEEGQEGRGAREGCMWQ